MWQTFTYYSILTLEAVVGFFGVRLYEGSTYKVLNRLDAGIEIRSYGPRVAAEVTLPRAFEAGRNEAFRLLFDYIAGANQGPNGERSRIAMTVPVESREETRIAMTVPVYTEQQGGHVRMRFSLPASYTLATSPVPDDDRVQIVEIASELIAAKRFSGRALDSDVDVKKAELISALEMSEWQHVSDPYTLFYDAPFTLPILRRNEVAVAVERRNGR